MVTSRFTLGAALVVLIQLIAPTGAAAQASREGPSFAASGGWGTVRLPDVAYDAAHGVYMAVSGNNTVGRFVGMNGDPVGGQFSVSTSPTHNQSARVAYSPDLEGFLVVWYDTRVNPNQYQVWGRIVRFDGAGPQFLTGDFFIGAPAGGANGELGIDVSYAFTSKRFLVAYNQIGPPTADIVAQLVDTVGNLVGGPQPLSLDDHWQREPSIAYDARYDNFMVAWGVFYNPAGPGAVHVRTVSASTGALGPVREVATGSSVYVPQVEYNSATQHFFVAWYTQPSIWGRTLAPDGTPVTNTSLVAYNYASYDGLGLSYNPVANSYFAIFHGRGTEDVGAQVSAGGVPDVEFTVTATPGIAGNYNPRVASHTGRGEWLVVTSSNFAQVTGQRVRSAGAAPPPPPPPPPPPSTGIELYGPNVPNGSWLFAEGAASAQANGFLTFYLVQNPNPVNVALRVFYSSDDGRLIVKNYVVPARSRLTLSLGAEVGAGAFSAVFQSQTVQADINVERSMYFGPNFEVSTAEKASHFLSTYWVFAEGSRGGELFDNFFLFFNPNPSTANVNVAFYTPNGGGAGQRTFTIPSGRRVTISANDIPELAGQDFGTIVTSDAGILVERSMFWRPVGTPPGTPWVGGHTALGAMGLNNRWFFAEGASAPGFETFYLVFNPTATTLVLEANFFTEAQGLVQRVIAVPPGGRQAIYANAVLGNIGGMAASFSGNTPFIAERSIYWGQGRAEGTNTIGETNVSWRWYLPEGVAGGNFETFLLLGNPNSTAATVDISLQIEGYGQITLPPSMRKVVPGWGRLTLYMPSVLRETEIAEGLPAGSLANASFGTTVRVFAGPPIIAEHAIYWRRDGSNFWRAGSAAFGTPR